MRAYQAVWTSPLSNRFLLEAAFSGMGFSYGREKEGNNRNLIQVMDQVGPITYRSMNWRPAVSWTPRIACLAVVRERRAQREGRLRPDGQHLRSHLPHQQPGTLLPVQQRRAEPADDGPQRLQAEGARSRRRGLRAGPVDAGPAHGAGRPALRLGQRQRAGADGRTGSLDSDPDRVPRPGPGAAAIATSACAAGWRTTCSATGRRR